MKYLASVCASSSCQAYRRKSTLFLPSKGSAHSSILGSLALRYAQKSFISRTGLLPLLSTDGSMRSGKRWANTQQGTTAKRLPCSRECATIASVASSGCMPTTSDALRSSAPVLVVDRACVDSSPPAIVPGGTSPSVQNAASKQAAMCTNGVPPLFRRARACLQRCCTDLVASTSLSPSSAAVQSVRQLTLV